MRPLRVISFLSHLFVFAFLFGQELPPGLSAVASRQWIKDNLYTGKHNTLSYDSARIYMFGIIDNTADSIECVYSGYRQFLAAGTNNVTYPNPVNTEHTVPQSFFSSQLPMLSDLFHLFPVYDQWNNDRGNNPFSDIPDNLTQKWIYKSLSQTGIPGSNIDLYSEYRTNTFEPREQHKGDLARAVFYFFTMYTLSGKNINDVASISTLCLWAKNDPPDAGEIARNNLIQQYQGNRNPYIDRPEWLMQAWGCTDIPLNIKSMGKAEPIRVFPNPTQHYVVVDIPVKFTGGSMHVYAITGELVHQQAISASGTLNLSLHSFPAGIYLVSLISGDGSATGEALLIKK